MTCSVRQRRALRPQLVRLCEAQNWRCCYCGVHMTTSARRDRSPSIEHVVPRFVGGSDDWENLVAACRLCNQGRGLMRAERYLTLVKWKGRRRAALYSRRLRTKLQTRQHIARLEAGRP